MDKNKQRLIAYAARKAQSNKQALSQLVCQRFMALSEYQQADTVMWYIHCRSEVQTQAAVSSALQQAKKIVIPYCTKDQQGQNKLGLWHLQDMAELIPGTWGILEPPKNRWSDADKQVLPTELDLVMVPGVAFDRKGGRLGNGAGYYDRLLQQLRPGTATIAVCYESQLFEQVVMEAHDVYMDAVLTETEIYR